MKVYFGVYVIRTRNGKIGARIKTAYLSRMPKDVLSLSTANEKQVIWFESRKRAEEHVKLLTKDNDRR